MENGQLAENIETIFNKTSEAVYYLPPNEKWSFKENDAKWCGNDGRNLLLKVNLNGQIINGVSERKIFF